jgi:hypothetical protein
LGQKLIGHFFKVRKKEIFMTITPTIATTNAAESTVKKELVISFAGLQRMRLRKLQANLANRVMTMRFKGEEPRDWEELLKEYSKFSDRLKTPMKLITQAANAVRDYDFICSCVDRPNDPFILSSARELEAGILSNELTHIPENLRSAQDGGWDAIEFVRPEWKDMFTRGELSQEARLKAFFERLGMAIFGGIFLIGPMWLMVLKPDRYTVLISTSVFVLAFAIVMAVALVKDTMVTVFSATAAYAAVLVVFVGTTTTPSSQ